MVFYNPSKIVTDLLSKYLEFDPEQLKLGIWSGNLSIQNVQLKREAMYPLLNGTPPPMDDDTRPPLKLKLVKGTVGHMRIRIPWKRLVWGQGDVKLQVSDVTIAVAYESREETAARNLPKEQETKAQEHEEAEDDEEEKKRKRDLKQQWLREAERSQLQGLPLPSMEDIEEKSDEEVNASDGQVSGGSSKGGLDSWLKSTTESFAWRFAAGLDASIRNVRVVIVQDGVEIGTIFHSMDIAPKTLYDKSVAERDQQDDTSAETPADPSMATPPPDVVPEGEYEDGEHLDKIVKLQGFGVFVRLENKRGKSPKTLQFSSSVAADDYVLRPTEGSLAVSIFDPYPPEKQTKKKPPPPIEEEPTTPTTATATIDSVTSSKSRRSKREKRPLPPDEGQTETATETLGSASGDSKPATQLRPALKRPERISSSTRQFSISETPTSTAGNRPKSHTVDLSGGISGGKHTRKTTVPRAVLGRVSTEGHKRLTSNISGAARSIPLLPADDTSSMKTPVARDGATSSSPPSLDLHLSFGDVTAMFSSRHYQLILMFKSTVERMENGRPDTTIASCLGGFGTDKQRTVYVDAPTSAVNNVEGPAITSQLSPTMLQSPRPSAVQRAQTTGGVDFSSSSAPRQRVKLQLQLELPTVRDENTKIIKSWWQYAYSTALYEVKKRRAEELAFDRRHLRFDWEKEKYKRREYVELYIATRLEPSSVLRTMELKVMLGTKSPEEELLKIEDELPVEQILLYRSIARSVRVRGMKKMPNSLLDLHSDQWLTASPRRKKAIPNDASVSSPPMSPSVGSVSSDGSRIEGDPDEARNATFLSGVEMDCTDINGIRREAEAVRMRASVSGDSRKHSALLKRLQENVVENGQGMKKATLHAQDLAPSKGASKVKEDVLSHSAKKVDSTDGRTVRTFKTAKTSQTGANAVGNEKDPSSGRLRISASIAFTNVELMVYQESTNEAESLDSMRFRPSYSGLSGDVLGARIRSSMGIQVVTNDSSSDVSDVSILSDDRIFFDQNDEALSISDSESVDAPIMSSADFLLFGLPRNVLLHAKVAGLAGRTRGQSGGQQVFSLEVKNVSVQGDRDSDLLSLKPTMADSSPPIEEVHLEKKKTPSKKKTAVSFAELETFQEQALLVSLLMKKTGKQLQCDLSKVIVTCDLQAALKIYDFFADVQVEFPKPLIVSTEISELRQYVTQFLATEKQGLVASDNGPSSAFRLHGLEIVIPGNGDSTSESVPSSTPEGAVAVNVGTRATVSMHLIEYYDGSLFEDILSISNDDVEDVSRMNEVPLSDKGWQHRNLSAASRTKLGDGRHSASSIHSVLCVTGIECAVTTTVASRSTTEHKLLETPVDVEVLVTHNPSTDFLSPRPRKQYSMEISPVLVTLSEARVGILSSIALSLSGMKRQSDDTAQVPAETMLPRLAALSIQILYVVELRISSMSLACVEDVSDIRPCDSVREIIMEESLSDFVSVLSCFNLDFPTRETVETAGNSCVDRLVVLGLSEDEAHACVHAARLNFIAGVDAMKRSQAQLMRELAESSQEMRTSSTFSGEDDHSEDLADDSVPSVDKISDDGSDESLDIIETTVKGAVEKTVSSFSSLLEKSHPVSTTFSELLLFDFPYGAHVSMSRMFYDLRVECHFKSFHVRNASGLHLLSLKCPYARQPKHGNDVHSSTALGSWEEDVGSSAASFSLFMLDREYDFGEGGLPLATMGSNEEEEEITKPRQREQLNHVVFGQIEVFFSHDIVADAIESMSRLAKSVQIGDGPRGNNEIRENNGSYDETTKSSLCVAVSSTVVTLASDELVPFCQVEAKSCTVNNALTPDTSSTPPRVNVVVLSLHMLDLTPEGYGYPDILYPMALKDLVGGSQCPSLSACYFPSPDKWKEPSKLDIELCGMRLFVVRRFLNELIQYVLSKNYGVGRLLDKFGFFDAIVDAKGNPQVPFHYKVALVDSSIILPRSSTTVDMMALEVEKMTLFNGTAESSFRMPTATSELKLSPNVVYQGTSSQSQRHQSFNSLVSDSEFFDCVDSDGSIGNENSDELSSFRKDWTKRTTVLLDKARIFTSLPLGRLSNRSPDDPLIHKFYTLKGRAVQNGQVYARRQEIDTAMPLNEVCKKPARVWREITSSDCSLEVIADFVPRLRLLITDRLVQREDCGEILSLDLDMRLSDLCLLLSIWYSNMQELPVIFPYDPAAVEATATSAQPSVPVPEYGTKMYVERLKTPSQMKSEIALVVDALSFRGSFDETGYFAEDPQSLKRYAVGSGGKFHRRTRVGKLPFKLSLGDFVLHVTTDTDGILRLGSGASQFQVVDERRKREFDNVFLIGDRIAVPSEESSSGDNTGTETDEAFQTTERRAWADMSWGLDCSARTLSGALAQPFQASVFMTPGWCLTNLGFEHADAILTDFSPIWILVDFFASYFKSGAYGNPAFEIAERKDELKRDLAGDSVHDVDSEAQASTNLDFRLWLLHPCICVPESLSVTAAPSLSIDCSTGFWYHYRSVDTCSLQEMGSTDLSLRFLEAFHPPSVCRSASVERKARALIEGLSFGLRMYSNTESQHTDYVFRVPLFDPQLHDEKALLSVASPVYGIKPIDLPLPTVCTPFVAPKRTTGPIVSEVTLFIDALPVALTILQNLLSGPADCPPVVEEASNLTGDDNDLERSLCAPNNENQGSSFSLVTHVDSFRVFAIDPILEKHLPVALLCMSPLEVNISQLSSKGSVESAANGEAFPDDLQFTMKLLVWADYFKLGTTRSWEPLLEPCRSLALYERSKRRGHGVSLNSDDSFHLNITGSLLLTLDENISSFSRAISQMFGDKNDPSSLGPEATNETPGACVSDELYTGSGPVLNVYHEIPKPIPVGGRTAFSFRNLTGQKIRIHQLVGSGSTTESKSVVAYLDHQETTTLSFDATISVIRNLSIVEVPFPGLQNSQRTDRGASLVDHEVDVQVPGFRWLSGISVNTSGRKFDSLVPVSPTVLEKVQQDWRLQNAVKILTEVGVENGGRLIAARSIFQVRNKTSHSIFLNFNPDPKKYPCADSADKASDATECLVESGASFQIPSLLVEASLELEGHHLGSFWLRPIDSKENKDLSYLSAQREDNDRETVVEFSSRPIQLAKLVHESALIFKSNGGEDLEPEQVRSGVQVSCPVVASREGAPLAPFCYVVEVRRSPLVKSREHVDLVESPVTTPKQEKHAPLHFKGGKNPERPLTQLRAREGDSKFVHGPVSYSLLVHPPLVIENLLPKRGRFELMHATRRTVLWFGDLNPGERIPIHTVGLDAPLLLMVNLGFCRTPVGEGALVHHGSDSANAKGVYNISHGGLKSIGKVVTKGTKQFAKAATAIAESPDKRGQGKLFLVQNPQFKGVSKSRKVVSGNVQVEGNPLGFETVAGGSDGKVHSIEHEYFDPTDVVDETVVVDSVGQRLTLNIDNVRGGGGQRRISLYCPLWIVNTTEHSLTYKQEKGSSFVSGTVLSPSKDGSRPVDDSDRNYTRDRKGSITEIRPAKSENMREGIFSGTPGALATSPGHCPRSPEAIISLLDKDLPLKTLTEVAFMFNFQLDILSIFKLCVQLSDGTGNSQYSSAWSQGFSLDSVGVNQVVSMPCKDGRALEVSMTLSVAPGLLSGYTKIVRFTPRFVLVNYLERPVRIWQDSSLLHPLYEGMDRPTVTSDHKRSKWHFKDENDPTSAINQYEYLFGRSAALDEENIGGITAGTTANKSALYIATAGTSDVVPFHLPDTRGERQLRIDLGGSWNLTSSFSADATGENIFKISRAVDSRMLSHVATRASPQYRVTLPPHDGDGIDPWDGELGVWFETDWGGDRRIIVQGIKRESYAFNYTDIHVGDELLRVDDFNVSQMTFQETMKVLKEKLTLMSVDARKNSKPKRRASAIILRRSKRLSGDDGTSETLYDPTTKVVLTFRTLEERLRRVRIKALKGRRVNAVRQGDTHPEVPTPGTEESEALSSEGAVSRSMDQENSSACIKVDMRMLHNTAFVLVRPPELESPPFRIENRAIDHIVFFRQRSCNSYPWNQVMPGESLAYTWEEPLRPRKLIVRVGPSNAIVPVEHADAQKQGEPSSNHGGADPDLEQEKAQADKERRRRTRSKRLKQLLSTQYVENEEEGGLGASVSVKLEVIGFADILPCPKASNSDASSPQDDDHLNCYVDTDGITRVLIITDENEKEDDRTEIENHVSVLKQQIREEEARKVKLHELRRFVRGGEVGRPVSSESTGEDEDPDDSKHEVDSFSPVAIQDPAPSRVPRDSRSSQAESMINTELQNMAEFPEDISITRCHQVYVEVIQAAGLKSSDASGMCNPYCEVVVKESSKSRKTFRSKAKEKRKTYYIENTTTPKWATQVFIFDISPEAVHATRGFSVRVRLRNFHWIGNHPNLGQTSVYLSTLRNQQELVGWYPLVGTKERSDADDSLGSYGRGSVKLRMQWIHSVPGLLDYFLMLSERRLLNLRRSVDGMGEQLTHAIEIQKTREQYADSLGSFPIPGSLVSIHGRRKARMTSGHIRKQSREGIDDLPTRKLPRPSIMFRMRDNLRKSRELHLWQLNSETTESRRKRRSGSGPKLFALEPEEAAAAAAAAAGVLRPSLDLKQSIPESADSNAEKDSLTNGSVSQGNNAEGIDQTGASETMGDAKESARQGNRQRSFSVPGVRLSTQNNDVFRDTWLLTPDIQEFSRLVRNQSLGGASSEGQGSVVYDVKNSFDSDHLWLNQREETMETLYKRGFLHHDGDAEGVYHDHLAYHVRQLLIDSSGNEHHSSIQNFRAKSALRLSPVIREFRSWTAAQAVFNDNHLDVDIVNNAFLIKVKDTPESSLNDGVSSSDFNSEAGNESEVNDFSAAWLKLPQALPREMRNRAMKRAHELATSRNQFESACKRSLRAVLNPGGWLTVRPMTALYLPDSCTGMFVKLRYGAEVVVSETVDAKVSPTWTPDTTVQVTPYAHIVQSSGKKRNAFEYGSSDLQVYIDPQRTSGSLRLSVIGERMNKTRVELGVLHIPLGAAINCCVECMEEIQEEKSEKHKTLLSSGVPAYVRWFPLMNPKEAVAVDGDLGHSSRPFESEQIRDNMFVQYFTPCVKLALIWQPNEDDIDDENGVRNRRQVATDANALPESPAAETYCNADIGRVSLALIGSQRATELVSLYVTDIDIRYSVTRAKTTSGLFLGNIQIDYQDDNAREPVVLAPTPGDNSQPTLQFVAVKDNLRSKSNITSYEYIWFSLQEMDLSLEESWMFDLWEFFMGIISRVEARNMSTFGAAVLPTDVDRAAEWTVLARSTPRGSLVEEHIIEPTLLTLLEENEPTNVGGKKMYVGQLVLGYVKINLSYLKGKKQSWEVNERGGITLRDPSGALNVTIGAGGMIVGRQDGNSMSPTFQRWSERTQDEELWTESEVKYSNLPKTFAAVFPSVSDAPIRLQGKVIEHVFESPDEIFSSIKGYYKDAILSQIYKIIGALDFVGNPSMLVSSFFSGVRDFFVTPSQAFLRSPNDPSRVGMGVAKGTLSLFSHSASGVFGFVSKMSASAGQIVAVLSLDDEFQQWHSDVIVAEAKGLNRQWKRRGVQSVPTMVMRPLYDVVRGLVLGVTGIVVNPYVGAKRRGCPGFAKGVAAGTLGVVAKPVAGVFDAFSHASGSAYDMAKSVNVLEKRYLPPKKLRLSYSFGPKGVLMPYDQVAARSMDLLETHPMKVSNDRADFVRAMGNEIHVASEVLPMEPGVETYAVASSHRIVLFQVKKESGGDLGTTMLWQVDLTRASSVSCKLQDQGHNGLALIITTTVPKKKVRIARNRAKTSPERKAATPSADINDKAGGVSQLSLYETATEVSTPFSPYIYADGDDDDDDDDDEQASELLGMDVSDFSDKPEFGPKAELHGSMKGKDGEVLEWYTIVAEYQQSRQLNRIHNAICCIIGDFDGVSSYRSGNQHGITEGYTSFGELFFGERPPEAAVLTTPSYDRAVCEDLNSLPWMYPSMFRSFAGKTPEKQMKLLGDMRNSWLFSREMSAVLNDGTPTALADTRARSTFVPHSPPSLPAGLEDSDEVVSEILAELKQGNISYDQACSLIESHAESAMVSVSPTPESGSEVSSVTEGHDVSLDQMFHSAVDREQVGPDVFHFAKQNFSSIRTPSEIRVLGGDDRPLSQTASMPGDYYASRSSLPFVDTMDSSELRSLAEKSLELQSLAEKSLKSAPLPAADSVVPMDASTAASLPLNASRGTRESQFVSARSKAPLRPRIESAPAGLAFPKSPHQPPAYSLAKLPEQGVLQHQPDLYDSWVSAADDVPAGQSRLSRMESMLEQLIIMNARQMSKSDGYTTAHHREEPEMIALRQEIADLRSQVHEATTSTDGSRREMIAALRREVKMLKEELKEEKRQNKKDNDESSHEDSHGVGDDVSARSSRVGATFDDQLNKVRPAAVKFARGLERRGESVAERIRQRVNQTIPEEEEEEEEVDKTFASF